MLFSVLKYVIKITSGHNGFQSHQKTVEILVFVHFEVRFSEIFYLFLQFLRHTWLLILQTFRECGHFSSLDKICATSSGQFLMVNTHKTSSCVTSSNKTSSYQKPGYRTSRIQNVHLPNVQLQNV
jgi:hypothetical protein